MATTAKYQYTILHNFLNDNFGQLTQHPVGPAADKADMVDPDLPLLVENDARRGHHAASKQQLVVVHLVDNAELVGRGRLVTRHPVEVVAENLPNSEIINRDITIFGRFLYYRYSYTSTTCQRWGKTSFKMTRQTFITSSGSGTSFLMMRLRNDIINSVTQTTVNRGIFQSISFRIRTSTFSKLEWGNEKKKAKLGNWDYWTDIGICFEITRKILIT